MIKMIKNTIPVIIIVLSLCLIGCGGQKQNYNESRYDLLQTPELIEEYNYQEMKEILEQANQYFQTCKSYSYEQTIVGESEEQYSFSGVTKINISDDNKPMASVELTGSANYGCYIVDNKIYLNYNGDKIVYETKENITDFVDSLQSTLIGSFASFDFNNVSENDIQYCGKDSFSTIIVKFNYQENTEIMIVIYENKIMKTIYNNDDEGINYIINYNYENVTIELPNDLDSYKVQ